METKSTKQALSHFYPQPDQIDTNRAQSRLRAVNACSRQTPCGSDACSVCMVALQDLIFAKIRNNHCASSHMTNITIALTNHTYDPSELVQDEMATARQNIKSILEDGGLGNRYWLGQMTIKDPWKAAQSKSGDRCFVAASLLTPEIPRAGRKDVRASLIFAGKEFGAAIPPREMFSIDVEMYEFFWHNGKYQYNRRSGLALERLKAFPKRRIEEVIFEFNAEPVL